MIGEYVNSILQSKNAVMFITVLVFITGILGYFNNCEVVLAGIISLIGILLIFSKRISIKYVLYWVLIFYLGFLNAQLRVNTIDDLYKVSPIDAEITGQIVSIPNKTNGNIKFFFKVNQIDGKPINAKTYMSLSDGEYNIGDNLKVNAKIRQPFKASNPSQFDYGKYLRNFNTFTTSYADNATILDTKLSLKWRFMKSLNKVRNDILENHSKHLKSPNLEILGGIVFGDDAVAPPDYIKTTFVNSGLLHILAASGMNVAFIFGFWFVIMRFFKIPYKLNIIGGLIMVILYTLMTGLGASVLRAALMLLFVQIGKLIDRDAHSVSLLAFVAMLLLIYNPAYINDVGFQLSFIVTFGLLTTAKIIFDKISDTKFPQWIIGAILIPIVAQVWVAPIQMFYFNTISTYSILANILTMPFLSVISFGGFVSSILATIRPIADFVTMCFDFILKYFLDAVVIISNYFSQIPHSIIQTTHPNILQLFMYYIILLLITLLIKFGFNKKLLYPILILALTLLISTVNIPNKNLEIIFFDVQNADAFLLKTPQNKYFIIDTAKLGYKSKNSTARLVISKYLKDRGIKNIEAMILTHFDLDHAGGAVDLMNDLNIKTVYVNSFKQENYTVKNIFKTIKEKQIPVYLAKNNSAIYSEDNLIIKTYIANVKNSDNENSVVSLLSYKDFDVLFMGDAGIIAFEKIKNNLPENIEVLKVGHHGGKNVVDKSMLQSLNSQVSIISTGPNAFGHPNKSTLAILRNTKIFRTDKLNSIKIKTNGEEYEVYSFNTLNKKYKKQLNLEVITH